ncbi:MULTISPECIES: serine/threonine-protein kinase [Pseudanabaena]|uniref:non-specific serine/threonine protein kinase n=2 Tax=Pseudanabaena TaxID=1152 RepID=L8N298_9CYAN|nr:MULTISPECIES: serine/threonine-protein kinase [Pseudanabaena]ELS32393.1 serine/threonine protein kinase [Pseudanabaena biceps PCC 7429]MDG3495384.1 tetratricopeptide repeat protein [Pseudanabaena catenata USMAC16]
MDGESCKRNGCNGTLEDGYCNVCGLAALKSSTTGQSRQYTAERITGRSSPITTGTGSSPLTNRSKGSRRTSTTGRSSRKQLGAGLVSVPELPSTEPEKAIMLEAKVPENKRFCANCNQALKREKGFCSQCGQKYSFIASLQPNDLILDQYEVKGAIAYGGLGWIYLGFDRTLSRYVVLKGLLNTEDASSAAVAVAERQFLASVKHANIVGIYNFVKHGSEGFIVMEYVGGQTLKEIRKSRGALPVTEAIAYIHRILSAFSYLHQQGLVYCDFKPDNAMVEGNDVKLIDMGGVRRIDDLTGDIYGTVGYSAPEAGEGPTVVSDLFTIGRTLAVLLADIRGFTKEHLYTLPSPEEEPLFKEQESLYRFLLKSTAENPDDRFQSADEMADQLLGVLREIVALQTNTPRPASSSLFGGDMLAIAVSGDFKPIVADYHQLPVPNLDGSDPAFNAVLNAGAISDSAKRVENLRQVVQKTPKSIEAKLRLVNALIDRKAYTEAESILAKVEELDAWDWRILWYRGRSLMAQGKYQEAQAAFDQTYFDLPGELAPKLALALAAERAHRYPFAIKMYELVCRTDPSYVTASFGLARCLLATGDRNGAVAALERVPQASSLFARSRVEVTRTLINTKVANPSSQELKDAGNAIEAIALEGMERYRLTKQVLETALTLVTTQALSPNTSLILLGKPLAEIHLREGLEKALRSMAHLATGEEKIRLVDEANRVRPKTLF